MKQKASAAKRHARKAWRDCRAVPGRRRSHHEQMMAVSAVFYFMLSEGVKESKAVDMAAECVGWGPRSVRSALQVYKENGWKEPEVVERRRDRAGKFPREQYTAVIKSSFGVELGVTQTRALLAKLGYAYGKKAIVNNVKMTPQRRQRLRQFMREMYDASSHNPCRARVQQ